MKQRSNARTQTILLSPVFTVCFILTACGGSGSSSPTTDTTAPVPVSVDWTGQACESPALQNVLGTYSGELQFADDAPRSCRWNTTIVIAGVNEQDSLICSLSGSVTAVLVEQGTQLAGAPYICAEMAQQTEFASGLLEGLDLNIATTNSLILQLDEPTVDVDANGLTRINAVTQFESLTVGGGNLIAANGTISRQN